MNLLKRLISKIVICPGCSKKLRLPIRPNKTLEVTCPTCARVFQIKFEVPPTKKYFAWAIWLTIIYLIVRVSLAHFSASLPPEKRTIIENPEGYIDV